MQLESPTENVRIASSGVLAFLHFDFCQTFDYAQCAASDPQFDTAAQRSWVYGGGNTKPKVAPKTRQHQPKTSLPGFGNPVLPTHGRRAKTFTDNQPRGLYNE